MFIIRSNALVDENLLFCFLILNDPTANLNTSIFSKYYLHFTICCFIRSNESLLDHLRLILYRIDKFSIQTFFSSFQQSKNRSLC